MSEPTRIDLVLAALADPTRRGLLEALLTDGPMTATSLAAERPVSRQAVAKHLDRLAEAGLVASERIGRETRWQATPEPLADLRAWVDRVGGAWDRRLGALAGIAASRAAGTPGGAEAEESR